MGTEAFWVPAVLAAAGAGASYVGQKNAQERTTNDTLANLRQQQELQSAGAAKANALTQKIAASTPDKIAGKATGDYVNTLRRAMGSPKGGQGTPTGGSTSGITPNLGGDRFKSDASASVNDVQNYGDTQAAELGQIDAATRQRQNEGLAMQDLGTNLNTLGAESYTKNFVNQLRASQDSQVAPWVGLASSLLGGAASASGAAYGGKKPPKGSAFTGDGKISGGYNSLNYNTPALQGPQLYSTG